MAGRLDNVIDGIEKVASRMVIYDAKPNSTIRKFAEGIEKNVGIISESFEMLFFEKERNRLRMQRRRMKTKRDMLLRKSLKQLAKEKDAAKIVEYKDIYEALEEVISNISLRYLQNRKGSLSE